MGQVLIDPSSLTAIGEAIRSKNKQIVKYKPNEMADAIKSLALDNSVTIQSNDAWKYVIDSTLEHQSITVKVSGKLTGDNTTGYKGEAIFTPYITSNFGWLAGKIKQTVDNTNHIVTFSAEAATEISGMLQDGWTPVYVVNNGYYTTTTPDNLDSLKSVSSSDNIENLLICGYYTVDTANKKLVATEGDIDIPGPISSNTKNYQNNYITTIRQDVFDICNGTIKTIDVPNVKTIDYAGFRELSNLYAVDISNATIVGNAFDLCDNLQYVILNNTTPPSNYDTYHTGTFLIPSSALDTYKSASDWSSYSEHFDAIENYNITRENCTITVTTKKEDTFKFSIKKASNRIATMVSNKGNSYELSAGLLNIFSYNDTNILITLDKSCSGANYLNKAVSLKITCASDNLGGTVTCSGINDVNASYNIATFAINTYVEDNPGCSINDIKTAFENGATLNFEMKTQ